MNQSRELELKRIANDVRFGIIEGVYNAGCGHPGGSLSIADMLTYLYFEEKETATTLEKEMATHSRVLAWRIPGTGEAWRAAVYGVAQSRTRLK